MAGQSFRLNLPPVIAPVGEEELIVGVEALAAELDERRRAARQHEGKTYRLWKEVELFTDSGDEDRFVFVVDRQAGVIKFAPAARATARIDPLKQ